MPYSISCRTSSTVWMPGTISPFAPASSALSTVPRVIWLMRASGVIPRASAARQQAAICNHYPDVRAKELRAKLAEVCGVRAEQVMVTDGATQGLNFIGEVFLRPGDEAIITPPTYPNYYKRMQATLVEVPLLPSHQRLILQFF